jgi:hypothetical protein
MDTNECHTRLKRFQAPTENIQTKCACLPSPLRDLGLSRMLISAHAFALKSRSVFGQLLLRRFIYSDYASACAVSKPTVTKKKYSELPMLHAPCDHQDEVLSALPPTPKCAPSRSSIYSALLTWSHPVRLTSWDVYSWRINYALPAHTVELTVGAYHLGISSETLFT